MSTHDGRKPVSRRIPVTFVVERARSRQVPQSCYRRSMYGHRVSRFRSIERKHLTCTRWRINFASPFRVNCDDITRRESLFRAIYRANLIFIGGQFPIYTTVVNVPRARNCRHLIAERLGVISG